MDFARQQRDPTRHVIGIAFVILMHVLVIYALMTGLGTQGGRSDQEAADGDDHRGDQAPPPPPPPPPPKKIVEPPKIQAPQPYVPPPDVPVPRRSRSRLSRPVTPTPPPEPVRDRAAAAAGSRGAAAPPKPAVRRGIVPISRVEPVYPREAIRDSISEGQRRRAAADRRKRQRHRREDRRVDSAACVRSGGHPGAVTVEVPARRRKYVAEVEVNFTLKD